MQEYNYIDQRVHQLSQIIAKVNRTFVPTKNDYSHTNLFFDPISHRVYGRWIDVENNKIILALSLKDFDFEWLNDKRQIIQSFDIQGQKMSDLEHAIAQSLAGFGLKKDGFSNKLHYEMPVYPFHSEAFESFDIKSRQNWEYYRRIANAACSELLGYLQIDGQIRIWPHHFDTGIYIEPNNSLGLGFGFAMEDGLVDVPYFYFSGYRLKGEAFDYTKVSELSFGKWKINDNWKGAVLGLSDLKKDNLEIVNTFLKEVSHWFLLN